MAFQEKRDLLLKEAMEFNNEINVSNKFKREFFDLVESIIIEQIELEDSFFGNFMLKIDRKIRLDISFPLATKANNQGFIMYFNPILFLNNSKREMGAMFKHEIYHIMFNHYEIEKELRNAYSKEAVSIALDISVNQFIKHLPMEYKRIEQVNREYNINLKEDMTAEYYAKEIDSSIKNFKEKKEKNVQSDKVKREYDLENSHNVWEEMEVDAENIKSLTKKTALSSINGDSPKSILDIIDRYKQEEEISWQNIIKRILPTVKCGYKKTTVRRNRRQPDRMDLRGRLRDIVPEVIVAIDISASMSEEEFKKIIIEVLAITRERVNKIKVIECDNKVRRVYDVKSHKDIKRRSNNTGSTAFSPVFNYIKEKRLEDRLLIYFTDGIGEKELNVNTRCKNVIWVLTGKEDISLQSTFGIIKRIHGKDQKGEGGASALQMIRGVIHDWAR